MFVWMKTTSRPWFHVITALLGFALVGCVARSSRAHVDTRGPEDWIAWQAKRRESVAGTNGWTTVVGLHWLKEGRNSAGSSPTNDVVLTSSGVRAHVGWFVRAGLFVRFEPARALVASADGKPVPTTGVDLETDANSKPSVLVLDGIRIVVLKRGERLGLRVRDARSAARLGFRGLSLFPYDPAWRKEGRFEPARGGETLRVRDVIGGIQEYRVPGRFVFSHAGVEHRLVAVEESGEEELFVIFRDTTAGDTTYAAGRFLYVAKPDASGRVILDFNRSYTPPCGFTPFATCPLPPKENLLPIAIVAGEKKPLGH